jgi:KUP system potassium uptake protein
MVILATAATVIASQALISGAFSVTKQVIQMGFLPRMQIDHTSEHDTGQIYIPLVNWGLFAVIVLAVAMFRSSSNLAAAYGIAVCTDMLITTVLTFFVIRYSWKYPLWLCLMATSAFLVVDLAFWASNLLKLTEGGWFPLLIASVILVVMLTWRDGRALLRKVNRAHSMELQVFLDSLFFSPPVRVEGTAVFMSTQYGMVPNAFLHNLKHNKVLHDTNVFVTVQSHEVPYIPVAERLSVKSMGNSSWEVVIHYGFKDDPDVPLALEPLTQHGCNLNPMTTSYFLSRDSIVPVIDGGMAQWREVLFAQMHLNASSAADFLKVPSNAVVELGSKIEI